MRGSVKLKQSRFAETFRLSRPITNDIKFSSFVSRLLSSKGAKFEEIKASFAIAWLLTRIQKIKI